ncbi:hypothetical protein RLOC_00013566 [Lonchura striata]|uniref:Uncharacterized protein n=1 Tax=Lonchura striata TaxID=40157 RepID=A0A218UDY1_9PASE|nr:hypothetical protein RLOC_00013566 [Lonchura striata domestica]
MLPFSALFPDFGNSLFVHSDQTLVFFFFGNVGFFGMGSELVTLRSLCVVCSQFSFNLGGNFRVFSKFFLFWGFLRGILGDFHGSSAAKSLEMAGMKKNGDFYKKISQIPKFPDLGINHLLPAFPISSLWNFCP